MTEATARDYDPEEAIQAVAAENFDRWNEALLSKKPETVANLYEDGATFLPTMSGDFRRDREGAEAYFLNFLQEDPYGTVRESHVEPLSDDTYLHSGMYDFVVGEENNRQTVEARFSFIWRQGDDGAWRIAHHHSSLRPSK